MSDHRVMRITKIQLSADAENEISHAAYKEVQQWLTQFTCESNFKAVIGAFDECINVLRADLKANLVPRWLALKGVKPEHFVFMVAGDNISNGRFWSTFSIGNSTPHRIY